jgi:hypothetical protein
MIPRYQRILFITLLAASALMVVFLIYSSNQNFSKVKKLDDTPIEAPTSSAAEQVTLDLADDTTGSVTAETRSLALPEQPAVRARALLEHLLAEYTLPRSKHQVGGGVAVDDVYLVQLPLRGGAPVTTKPVQGASAAPAPADPLADATGELAVVNLRSSWADAHPSGITSETLTIQSIVSTLHTNLPDISHVQFLVDGAPRATLAGNIELDRTYDTSDTVLVQTAPEAR